MHKLYTAIGLFQVCFPDFYMAVFNDSVKTAKKILPFHLLKLFEREIKKQ